MIYRRFFSISLEYLFFLGWCFHCEIKRKLPTAGLLFHVTQQLLSSNRRILDPAACIEKLSVELRPLLTCRQIQPAVSTRPEGSSLTVGDRRGPLLTARGSQPTASHAPLAEKQICPGNPWRGVSAMDYLLRKVIHRKIYSSGEH